MFYYFQWLNLLFWISFFFVIGIIFIMCLYIEYFRIWCRFFYQNRLVKVSIKFQNQINTNINYIQSVQCSSAIHTYIMSQWTCKWEFSARARKCWPISSNIKCNSCLPKVNRIAIQGPIWKVGICWKKHISGSQSDKCENRTKLWYWWRMGFSS